jgi:hypothetical protein
MRIAALLAAGLLLGACGTTSAPPDAAHLSTAVQDLRAGQVVDSVPCLSVDLPEIHIHVHLALYDDGTQVTVPAGIGVGRPWGFDNTGFLASGSCFAWMHTHDTTGVVHVVTPQQTGFTLGQLFSVWGQPLTSTGAFNYSGELAVLVDGRRTNGNPRDIPLTQYENVVVELGKPPAVAPASIYDFSTMRR